LFMKKLIRGLPPYRALGAKVGAEQIGRNEHHRTTHW